MKPIDMERSSDGLSMWSLDFTRERGGPPWKWPRTQHWKSRKEGKVTAVHFRMGWRLTAFGVHICKQHLTSTQVEDVARREDEQ